jgi:phytoene desaturase
MKSRVAIIGGGPGGLCAAMLLAGRGFDVTLFEKEATVGGRSGSLSLGEYRFDLGSTILMMRFVLDEMFALAGSKLDDEVKLVRIDPMYRLDFGDRWLDMYSDPVRMEEELRRFAPGSEPGLLRFLECEHERLEHLYPLMQKNWPNLASLVDPALLLALPHVGLGQSLHDVARGYFRDEELQSCSLASRFSQRTSACRRGSVPAASGWFRTWSTRGASTTPSAACTRFAKP